MQDKKPSYEDLQKRVSQLELRLRQIESRDYITKENDAELEALRIDYELVFRNANFYVAFYRPNGEIVAYNKIAADEVGYSPDELVDKTVWDIFNEAQADLFYSRMQQAMNDGNILKFEELNETKVGRSWYETSYIPVYDEDGELIGCQVLARDIGEKKNAIQDLEYNKELIRRFFEQSNAGIAIANTNGKFVDLNTRFADMLGYTVEELLVMHFVDITYDTDLKEEQKYIQQILNQEIEEYTIEKRYKRKNGEVFWVNLSATVIRDKDRKPLYSVGIVIDIQKLKDTRKELVKSKDKYKLLIDNQIEGVVISGKNEDFLFANRAAEKIFGVNSGELTGKKLEDFLSEPAIKFVKNETKKRSKGESSSYELDIIKPNKQKVNLFVHAIPNVNENGKFAGTLAFFRDITTQKEAERKAKEKTIELQKLNLTKNKLLSIIGHDLRSPLNNINGFVYLIEKNLGPDYDPKTKKYINAIFHSSNTLLGLLENLLAWSRSQMHDLKLNLEQINLYDTVEMNIQHFLHNATFKSINLVNEVEKSFEIKADKSMLNTIIRNLLSNAIKYTSRKGEVVISAETFQNTVKLCVKDSGIGLSEELFQSVLNGGSNLNRPGTMGEKGTGVGLQIVKDLVHLHNGQFGIDNQSKSGTTFYLELPQNLS